MNASPEQGLVCGSPGPGVDPPVAVEPPPAQPTVAGPEALMQASAVQANKAAVGHPLLQEVDLGDAVRPAMLPRQREAFRDEAIDAWTAFVSRPEDVKTSRTSSRAIVVLAVVALLTLVVVMATGPGSGVLG